MIDSAKAVNMLMSSVVTPLVTQSEQALHHLQIGKWTTDGLQKTSVRPDLGFTPGHVKQGCQRQQHLRQAGQIDEGSRKPLCWLIFCGLVLAEAHMERATDVVAIGRPNDRAPRGDPHVGSHAVPQEGP